MKMIRILLFFIRAERTGDWELHLYCIVKMIPIFHAGGHTAYAKSARLYLDQMKELQSIMSESQYKKFTSEGYWTIRRPDRFWCGVFTDQTIEQILMRMLKARGGIARGRGITASTQAKMVHILPQTAPICESLESFTGTQSLTSDQHKDLRATTTARDGAHFNKFKAYLSQHAPFSYSGENKDKLVCIATGVVAPETANADLAIKVGEEAASRLTGISYTDAKLKRNDKVISIAIANNSAKIRGHQVEINPMSLFMRVTCVIQNRSEMKDHLKHEFSKQPPSIFENGIMRKNTKSVLANALKAYVNPTPIGDLQNPLYVVDGGHLLQSVIWPNDGTYKDIIDNYSGYVLNNYGTGAIICFDGYSNPYLSTKLA